MAELDAGGGLSFWGSFGSRKSLAKKSIEFPTRHVELDLG